MPDLRNLSKREKGIAVMLTAIMLMFTIPFVGLSIDAGAVYMVKARLQAASDAAALAAARSLNLGMTLAEQETNARARAVAYYQTNFPTEYMGSTNSQIETEFAMLNASTVEVRVTTRVDTPLYFMRILGLEQSTIRALGTATRRNVNLYLILDRSGSMSGAPCTAMKTAAQTFTNYFAAGRDQLGLISFNGAWRLNYMATPNFKTAPTINSAIAALSCSGTTGTAQAIWKGYEHLIALAQPLALNVLVFFTDGQPNGIAARYPIKTLPDRRFGDGNSQTLTIPREDGVPGTQSRTWNFPSTSTLYDYPPSSCRLMPNGTNQWWYRDNESTASPDYWAYRDAAGNNYTVNNINPGWDTNRPNPPGYHFILGSNSRGGDPPPLTGTTNGLIDPNNQSEPTVAATGCAYTSSLGKDAFRRDFAYVPLQDIYGNNTRGFRNHWNYVTNAYESTDVDWYPAGHTYATEMRVDRPSTVSNAFYNAADHAGRRARMDGTYNPTIFSIGLGGNPGMPADDELLARLSNDGSTDDSYLDDNFTRPRGLYVYAPNSTQLTQAFIQIASSVLRLSQ